MIIAIGSSSRDNSSGGSSIPVIFGVIGGVFLLLIIVLSAAIIYFKYLQGKDPAVLESSLQGSKLHILLLIMHNFDVCIDHKVNEHQAAYAEVTDAIYDTVDAEQKSCVTYEVRT